jgi:hypothetical protein
MPTPFTHLRTAQMLLRDPQIPPVFGSLLDSQRSAFLLGSVAADARVNSGLRRADTHFYHYDQPMSDHPWRVMMSLYPALQTPHDAAQQAFLAGYVAHLSMDEVWTNDMLYTHFFAGEWGADRRFRFFMLHILLIYMDERDYALLEDWQANTLFAARPVDWLPFMTDYDLMDWRDFIAAQVAGESQTLTVLGERTQRPPQDFRAVLDSPQRMQADLWNNIPFDVFQRVEQQMYTFARDQMIVYLEESAAHS